MKLSKGERKSIFIMASIFVFTIILALAISIPFSDAGMQAFEDPEDPMNPIIYLGMILLFTGLILLLIKSGRKNVIQSLILFVSGLVLYTIFVLPYGYLILAMTGHSIYSTTIPDSIIMFIHLMAAGSAFYLTWVLYKNPEWYIINSVGIIIGAGVTAILGISLGILPVLILLMALAIYDAISVYKTKHMITLADAVTEKHLPVLLVVPKTKNYSFKKQKGIKTHLKKKKKMDAMFMGLGDIVIPGSLAVSAFTFLSADGPTMDSTIVAALTLVGGLAGFYALMHYVMKGRPQAGLPLLNSGAILGFAVGYFILYWL